MLGHINFLNLISELPLEAWADTFKWIYKLVDTRNFKQIHKLVHKLDHSSTVFYSDPKFTSEPSQYLGGQVFYGKNYPFFKG